MVGAGRCRHQRSGWMLAATTQLDGSSSDSPASFSCLRSQRFTRCLSQKETAAAANQDLHHFTSSSALLLKPPQTESSFFSTVLHLQGNRTLKSDRLIPDNHTTDRDYFQCVEAQASTKKRTNSSVSEICWGKRNNRLCCHDNRSFYRLPTWWLNCSGAEKLSGWSSFCLLCYVFKSIRPRRCQGRSSCLNDHLM